MFSLRQAEGENSLKRAGKKERKKEKKIGETERQKKKFSDEVKKGERRTQKERVGTAKTEAVPGGRASK